MGFKIGDRITSRGEQTAKLVRGVDDEVGELWLRSSDGTGNWTEQADKCTLYVPPPEVGKRYYAKSWSAHSSEELIAVRDNKGILYGHGNCWVVPLADLIPAEAP
jgi:hypothetical protein